MEFLSQTDVIILALGTLFLGMGILVKGGDWTIDGAVQIARHYGMPPLLVGFTIVAFGTSLPELIASINANMKGAPGLAVGNVIGSNVANILLIAGVSATIMPLRASLKSVRNDLIMLGFASVLWAFFLLTMPIGMAVGASALGLLIGYVIMQYFLTKGEGEALIENDDEGEAGCVSCGKACVMVCAGLVGLALGAELLIRGAVTTAKIFEVPDSVIGLTIIALGTSLPELTTCAAAALKKQGDMILGNLIGSNVFNLMMILGSMGVIKAFDIRQGETMMLAQDLPFMLGVTGAFVLTLVIFRKIPRWAGVVYVLAYVGYMVLLAVQSMQTAGTV